LESRLDPPNLNDLEIGEGMLAKFIGVIPGPEDLAEQLTMKWVG
jgi:hypothetical protein